MSQKVFSGSFSPKLSPTFSPSPCTNKEKTLTKLFSKCKNIESSLSTARKAINSTSSSNNKKVQKLQKELNSKPEDLEYKEIYNKTKKILKNPNYQLSEMQKKIDLLLDPKHVEKNLPDHYKQNKSDKKILIDVEEIRNNEAKELLKRNKRQFGEHFLVVDGKKEISSSMSPRIKPPMLPFITKSSLKTKTLELLGNYKEEKNNVKEKMFVEKLIHKNLNNF